MSYTRPDRTIEPFRDLSIEGFGKRTHSHRKAPNIAPCVDPARVLSANILKDPGFEQQTAVFGTGPNLANDIPHSTIAASNIPLRWVDPTDTNSTNDPEAGRSTYWMQDFTQKLDVRWQTSAVSPRSGTRHARKLMETRTVSNGAGLDDGIMFPYQITRCAAPITTGQELATAAVLPGDTVTWSFYMVADVLTSSPLVHLQMNALAADWSDTLSNAFWEVLNLNLTASLQAVMPAGAGWVQCWAAPDHTTGVVATTVDMDDAIVSIA